METELRHKMTWSQRHKKKIIEENDDSEMKLGFLKWILLSIYANLFNIYHTRLFIFPLTIVICL